MGKRTCSYVSRMQCILFLFHEKLKKTLERGGGGKGGKKGSGVVVRITDVELPQTQLRRRWREDDWLDLQQMN